MPKPKPTQVIRHEIILGRREFEMIETLSAAISINKVSEPIVEILKDGTALLAVACARFASTGLLRKSPC